MYVTHNEKNYLLSGALKKSFANPCVDDESEDIEVS